MRRVIVESPFAPQTPLPPGFKPGWHSCDWQPGGAFGCDICPVLAVRAEESARNARYLDACLRDCLRRGEAPFASHRMYTSALDDLKPEERALGIAAGFAWRKAAESTVIYTDLGWSSGMRAGLEHTMRLICARPEHEIEYRTLGPDWDSRK